MPKPYKVLYVEDDLASAKIVVRFLEKKGVVVKHVMNGKNIDYHLVRFIPDCVLLDIGLPGPSGYDLVRVIRKVHQKPIVFITSTASEEIEILSLKLGVDDFISKQVSLDLLFERLTRFNKTLSNYSNNDSIHQVGGLCVDKEKQLCTWNGVTLALTKDEMNAVHYFIINKDRVIPRDELFMALTGVPFDGISRGMDIKISRIKEKFISAGLDKNVFTTKRGVGYMLNSSLLMPMKQDEDTLSMNEMEFIHQTVRG